jgi:hypothetical protein
LLAAAAAAAALLPLPPRARRARTRGMAASGRPGGTPPLTREEAEAQYGSYLRRTEAAEAAALTEFVDDGAVRVHHPLDGKGKVPKLRGIVTELLQAETKDVNHPRRWRGSLKRLVSMGASLIRKLGCAVVEAAPAV